MSIHSDNPEAEALLRQLENMQNQNPIPNKGRSKVFDEHYRKKKPVRYFILKIRELSIANIIGISLLFGIATGYVFSERYDYYWGYKLSYTQFMNLKEKKDFSYRMLDSKNEFNSEFSIISGASLMGLLLAIKKK
nr:hypothetical protein [uncultured Draconibacterium sp.]